MNTKIFCCKFLQESLDGPHDAIGYSSKVREYKMKLRSKGVVQLINYCPWCGAQLPVSLRDQWLDILENEFGIENPLIEPTEKLPTEFQSDEWWEKRGL